MRRGEGVACPCEADDFGLKGMSILNYKEVLFVI